MAPVNKAKAAGVSASSFLDLKAELAKREADSSKSKDLRNTRIASKKPSIWARPNKGVKGRAAKDVVELEQVSKPTLEKARAVLERKAKIYEQLRRGKTAGLNEKQYDELLVDFDQNVGNVYYSDSDDVDESLTVPKGPQAGEDDPVVEYEDEFGRVRTARKSEVPRHLAPPEPSAADSIFDDDADVIYNPVNHFPTYEPSAERISQIQESLSEEANPLNVHYDANAEVRAKGAAFYQFSADEETRKREMEELRLAREETGKIRKEGGAVDVRAGDVEGMRPGEGEGEGGGGQEDLASTAKSRAMEKRKRDLEERRKMVDAKRRKIKGGLAEEVKGNPTPDERPTTPDASRTFWPKPRARSPPLPSTAAPAITTSIPQPSPEDPFAALEARIPTTSSSHSRSKSKGKGKGRLRTSTPPLTSVNSDIAGEFLEQLERDIMG